MQGKKGGTLAAEVLGEGVCRRCFWNRTLTTAALKRQGAVGAQVPECVGKALAWAGRVCVYREAVGSPQFPQGVSCKGY